MENHSEEASESRTPAAALSEATEHTDKRLLSFGFVKVTSLLREPSFCGRKPEGPGGHGQAACEMDACDPGLPPPRDETRRLK